MKQVLLVALLAGCLVGFAGSEVASTVPKDDKAAIESFFREFVNSFNSKDVERVRKMSGETWKKWSKNMNDGVRLENLRIVNVEFDKVLKVFAKVPIVEDDGKSRLYEVLFTLKKNDGSYFIQNMVEPKVEKRNQEGREAFNTVRKLATAINAHDMGSARVLLSFKDAADFEKELSSRGLVWIKEMIENKVTIPEGNIGAGYEERNRLIGRIDAPVVFGGANILRRFYFNDGKIDRAAPRRETKEEFLKRFEKGKGECCRRYQAEKAEQEYKKYEEALK